MMPPGVHSHIVLHVILGVEWLGRGTCTCPAVMDIVRQFSKVVVLSPPSSNVGRFRMIHFQLYWLGDGFMSLLLRVFLVRWYPHFHLPNQTHI